MTRSGVEIHTDDFNPVGIDPFGHIFKHLDSHQLQAAHVLCPMCRQQVNGVHKLENLYLPPSWNDELTLLTLKIMQDNHVGDS